MNNLSIEMQSTDSLDSTQDGLEDIPGSSMSKVKDYIVCGARNTRFPHETSVVFGQTSLACVLEKTSSSSCLDRLT